MHVLTSLEELHQQQKIVTALMQKMMSHLKQNDVDVELPSNINLPISDMNAVDEIEEALENEQTKKMLVRYALFQYIIMCLLLDF